MIICSTGTVTLWHCNTVTLWHCNTVTLWHCDTVTLWHCDTVNRLANLSEPRQPLKSLRSTLMPPARTPMWSTWSTVVTVVTSTLGRLRKLSTPDSANTRVMWETMKHQKLRETTSIREDIVCLTWEWLFLKKFTVQTQTTGRKGNQCGFGNSIQNTRG